MASAALPASPSPRRRTGRTPATSRTAGAGAGGNADRPSPILEAKPDSRRTLVQEFWRLVHRGPRRGVPLRERAEHRVRGSGMLEELVESAESAGYGVRLLHINAVEYGVPECRHRIVLLGPVRGEPASPVHALRGAAAGLGPPPRRDGRRSPPAFPVGRVRRAGGGRHGPLGGAASADTARLELQAFHGLGGPSLAALRGRDPLLDASSSSCIPTSLPGPSRPIRGRGSVHSTGTLAGCGRRAAALQGFPHGYSFVGNAASGAIRSATPCRRRWRGRSSSRCRPQCWPAAPARPQGQGGPRMMPCVSLFSGCGGLDLGLSQAGFHDGLAVDNGTALRRRATRPIPRTRRSRGVGDRPDRGR